MHNLWDNNVKLLLTKISEAAEAEEDDETTLETVYITGMMLPYIDYEVTGWVLAQVRNVSLEL